MRSHLLYAFTDRELIEALKLRGYVVPKKPYVRIAHARAAYPVHEVQAMQANDSWFNSCQRMLGRQMGSFLLSAGAFEFHIHDEVPDGPSPGLQDLEVVATVIVPDPAIQLEDPHRV